MFLSLFALLLCSSFNYFKKKNLSRNGKSDDDPLRRPNMDGFISAELASLPHFFMTLNYISQLWGHRKSNFCSWRRSTQQGKVPLQFVVVIRSILIQRVKDRKLIQFQPCQHPPILEDSILDSGPCPPRQLEHLQRNHL